MQVLQDNSGSAAVTLPKQDLQRDGVITDGDIPGNQNVVVDRLGQCVYLVRLVDDGVVPDAEETEVVERLAAQRIMQQDAYGNHSPADD